MVNLVVLKQPRVQFFAGGNGIPGMYSEATHLASRRSIRSSKR